MQTDNRHNVAYGITLRRLRQQKNLTQEQLGFDSGVARNHISRLEMGLMSPSLNTIIALCQALNVPFMVFMALLDEAMRGPGNDA